MKKIMILGSGGMLGHMVYYHLKNLDKYKIVDASFPEKLHGKSKLLDVTDKKELENYIEAETPDVVVNCIGILIQGSQNDPSNAIYLNSFFPHQLAKLLRKTGGRLIHISTDCVFSGKNGPYIEDDFRDADDTYGRSKALGEVINDIDVTLRTSIVGPELKEKGEGLFHWFMQQTGTIKGFTQAYWGGVTTLELAKVIDQVIEQNITGLIHITNGVPISKYELLKLFKNIFNRTDIEIEPFKNKTVNKSLKSVRSDFSFDFSSYDMMIKEMNIFMIENKNLYSKNYRL
jgi:dTDP-4-dehydrorhamnose reductase